MKKEKDQSELITRINKKFGTVIKSGRELANRKLEIIPVSPAHNLALGGGIPLGSWVTVAGKPKTHKSTTCLHIAAKCQEAGMEVYYGNIEARIKQRDLGIAGLDPDKMHIIESSEDKFMTAVDYLTAFEDILKSTKRSLLIIDSVSMLADEKEIEGGIGTSTRGGGAKYLAQFCRNMTGVVNVKNHIVIGIMQLMANTSGYGSPFQEKGGNAIVYQADIRMMVKQSTLIENDDKVTGATVKWQLNASALNTPPGQEYESTIRYGVGIDEITESVIIGEALGLITKAGAWYSTDYTKGKLEVKKLQGVDKVREFLTSNRDYLSLLEQQIGVIC